MTMVNGESHQRRSAVEGQEKRLMHDLNNVKIDTVISSNRVVIHGKVQAAQLALSSELGLICGIRDEILPRSSFPTDVTYIDYSPKILLPGIVDAHVHLNEPGRTEWEGFWTGTQAAAFGGVTTVIDMPLNSIPPTTTVHGFDEKIKAARGQCWVDVGFYGGMVPGNSHELKLLVKKGVKGFKGFLIDSGVQEFPAVSSEDIMKAMRELADESTTLMFHAEMIPPITDSVGDEVQWSLPPLSPSGPLTSYQTFLDSRPSAFETYAIGEIISLARFAPDLDLHIVHLSAIEAIPQLREARANGVKITAETCYHYLSLAAEVIREGDTRHKCCPPIRGQSNQDGLWHEMLHSPDSVIKTVVSDHSPCTPDLKLLPPQVAGAVPNDALDSEEGNFFSAWGGVSSVGLGLPILCTESQNRKFSIVDIVKWCCENTAKQVGLYPQKGQLEVGSDADFVVLDDEAEFQVQPTTMLFRNKCSPYEGKRLKGVVKETWLRSRPVYSNEKGFDLARGPSGQLLIEPEADAFKDQNGTPKSRLYAESLMN